MDRIPYEPPRRWPLDLFHGKLRPPAEDALILVAAGHEAQESDDVERFAREAWEFLDGAIESAFQRYGEGALPLEAVEVTAALTAIARPKDYGCHPVWDVGLALGAIQLEGDDAGRARRERSKEAAAGARIALIGAGGSLLASVMEARPIVFQNQHLGLPWAAMCSAFDAIGAGSFVALERLGAIVDQAGDCPALLWLDEVACRVARETGRAQRRAAALDRALAPGVLHKNAVELAFVVTLAREELVDSKADHDAWLRLGAAVQKASGLPAVEDEPPEVEVDWKRVRETMPRVAAFLRNLDAQIAESKREIQIEKELHGPFYWGSGDAPREVIQAIDGVMHYALLGFRQLYGLELLCDALPRLSEALQAGEVFGQVN